MTAFIFATHACPLGVQEAKWEGNEWQETERTEQATKLSEVTRKEQEEII